MAIMLPKVVRIPYHIPNRRGFTLIELLVTIVVAMVAIASVYSVYIVQQHEHRNQRSQLTAQQNLRSAIVILEQEIRMAGFDPEDSGQFGFTDIRRYDLVGTAAAPQGQPALFYTRDSNEDGRLDPNETYGLRIRDDRTIGRTYLTMSIGRGGRQRLAENIQTWGLAYAVDVDRDGRPDTWPDSDQIIWAVDSDNDNHLDTHLDTNHDGKIDLSDDADGDRSISRADGAPLNPPISVDRIKAIRVWLLSTSGRASPEYHDDRSLVVGDRIIVPQQDGFQRRVVEVIIGCRNM